MNSQQESDSYRFIADLYDWVVPYRSRQDVGFYVEEACSSGGPVLEIGCGSGRVLIPTAQAGINIWGLDSSEHMLQVCKDRLENETQEVKERVTLVREDMRSFDLDRKFALITTPFRPFQHLIAVEDQLQCLACIRRHLTDNGKFILDIFNPSLESLAAKEFGMEFGDEPEFTTPDGRRVVRRTKILARDLANQVTSAELIYYVSHADGRLERLVHAFDMRHLFRFEAEHLLARAGLRVEQLYADFDRSPFGSKYPGELIFVASKI